MQERINAASELGRFDSDAARSALWRGLRQWHKDNLFQAGVLEEITPVNGSMAHRLELEASLEQALVRSIIDPRGYLLEQDQWTELRGLSLTRVVRDVIETTAERFTR